jgi:hypothetical protein
MRRFTLFIGAVLAIPAAGQARAEVRDATAKESVARDVPDVPETEPDVSVEFDAAEVEPDVWIEPDVPETEPDVWIEPDVPVTPEAGPEYDDFSAWVCRPEAEAECRALCESLGCPITVCDPELCGGGICIETMPGAPHGCSCSECACAPGAAVCDWVCGGHASGTAGRACAEGTDCDCEHFDAGVPRDISDVQSRDGAPADAGDDPPEVAIDDEGCGCAVPGAAHGGWGIAALACLVVIVLRARRSAPTTGGGAACARRASSPSTPRR